MAVWWWGELARPVCAGAGSVRSAPAPAPSAALPHPPSEEMPLPVRRINTDSPVYQKWSKGPCGSLWQGLVSCHSTSESQIRGMDCAEQMKEYLSCCEQDEGACKPSLTDDTDKLTNEELFPTE